MYFNLLPKQQLKYVARILQKRQVIQMSTNQFLHRGKAEEVATNEIIEGERNYLAEPKMFRAIQRAYTTMETDNVASSSKDKTSAGTVATTSEEEGEIALGDVDVELTNFPVKSMLYNEEMDDIMIQLNGCQNEEQLLDTMTRYDSALQSQHRVQCIVLLWIFYCNHNEIGHPNAKLLAALDRAVLGLLTHISALDANELSCCYLYLRKMGVDNTHAVLQEILIQALHAVEIASNPISLSALSRLVVGINIDRVFHTPTVCQHFMPHIVAHIESCASEQNARLLAICLINLQPLVCPDILHSFKVRIHQLINDGIISNSETSSKTILKLLHLLNLPKWSQRNSHLIRELLLLLNVPQLYSHDLKTISRIFQYHLEPAAIVAPLIEATEKLLTHHTTLDNLACFMSFDEPRRREPLVALFRRLLFANDSWKSPNASGNLFTILRGLKISDVRMCDAYWANVMNEVASCPEEATKLRFLRHCHRYMNFNNNLGGTYRFFPLERRLSQMAMRAIEHDIAGRIPEKFARLASFVLAYGHTPFSWKKFPNVILSKIINMSEQFDVTACFLISRGMQIASEMRFRYHTPPLIGMQFSTIDSVLINCAERHLSSKESLPITELNVIVRTLAHRKSLRNSTISHDALNKYKELDYTELNSRFIREMSYNFNASNFIVPNALDAMFNYIEHNHGYVTGDTVEKVLTCAYNLGYTPQSQDVLEYAAITLMRDFNYMSGLALVQACLALCYYKTIPEELINKVFCVKFIQRVEEEIQMCYSKATYPERVLNLVMQLNRTVCLDFPEANVPWFQQNYLEAQLSKKPFVKSKFNNDVQKLLELVLKDETYFRCNHTTPYGYQIDFVIHFDTNKKPIPAPPVETTMLDRITKVAILLLKLDSFCENDLTALRGPEYLKTKHLEMMGYKVLHINEHDWNSKYLNVPDAKANYLKCLLQITN